MIVPNMHFTGKTLHCCDDCRRSTRTIFVRRASDVLIRKLVVKDVGCVLYKTIRSVGEKQLITVVAIQLLALESVLVDARS